MKTNYTTTMITLALGFGLATQAFASSDLDFSRTNPIRSQRDAITVSSTPASASPLQADAFNNIDTLSRSQDRAPRIADLKGSGNATSATGSFNNNFVTVNVGNN